MHLAIDYGSRLAGTTALCFEKNGSLQLLQSAKKQDADAWLRQVIAEQKPGAVYIDAPLSLPGVYTGRGSDYFYRIADRALGAMSPMFLGGLTARAMQLRAAVPAVPFYEIYPAQLVRTLFPGDVFYKKELPAFLEKLTGILPLPLAVLPENWHQTDAVLAWLSGWRHGRGEALTFGEEWEGVIRV
jgi:predicted nuclease with RNAse H fold